MKGERPRHRRSRQIAVANSSNIELLAACIWPVFRRPLPYIVPPSAACRVCLICRLPRKPRIRVHHEVPDQRGKRGRANTSAAGEAVHCVAVAVQRFEAVSRSLTALLIWE